MQINSDYQKPRRFALRLLVAGYLRRYTKEFIQQRVKRRMRIT